MTRTALTALAVSLTLLASASVASAAPAATVKATKGCWLEVINDWLDNNRVDKTYALPCYTQAIQQLNRYPDVQDYSSAADDIHRALLMAAHDRANGGSNGGGTSGGGGAAGGGGSGTSGGNGTGGGSNPVGSIFHSGRPSSAQSVPLPLLVLGGLAALLLLSATGTWLVRRTQSRRRPPGAPTPVDERG